MTTQAPVLSIVIPVFNEEGSLEPLIDELCRALDPIGTAYEILCIDDKSTDRSRAVLERLAETVAPLRMVEHRRNFGQSAALATGFACARGDVIVTLDGDRQNDPADLPKFLDALADDVDCVCGVRTRREDDWVKRVSSRIANGFRNWITGETIADAGCTYRAVRRGALREVLVFNGMHRFLPTILRLQGMKVVEIPVNHRPREAGVSKYGVANRLWRGIADCLAMRWYRRRALPLARFEPPE